MGWDRYGMGLNKEQRKAIIDFLVPLLNDLSKRQMHMDLLFAGEENRPDLDVHGAPRETTTRIVLKLETYFIEPQKPALFDLLTQSSDYVGVDQRAQIEAWQSALLTPATPVSQPLSISTPVGKQRAAPEPKIFAPAKPSRAEQFSLPGPFEWITIPAGKVTLEGKNESYLKETTTFDVPEFAISKYPLTVNQYRKFVGMGGYDDQNYWTKDGRKWAKNNRGRAEAFMLNQLNTPPVTATWHEARAFCTWLRRMTDEPVFLPTEQQWQRAAQGEDRRIYPWGNEWNSTRCNNSLDASINNPGFTPVQQYALWGDSAYGVVDMVGNAAEWTMTNWTTGEQGGNGDAARVVRGGSYQNQHLNFYRVTTRHKEWPTQECGFRIVRLLDT